MSLVKIDFGFELIKKKTIDCITDLYMYSLTLDTQEYEELSSQLFLYKMISQLLFYQSSLTPPPPTPHARYLKSKHSWHLHLLYSISESNLWLTLSPGYYKL